MIITNITKKLKNIISSISIPQIIQIAIIYAIGFGVIETITRQIDIYIFNIIPLHSYTTYPQFLLTFIWTPFVLKHKKINNNILRCLLYPINIYMCEIIGGNIILCCFNYRAWHYTDKYAMFNGMITLSYYPMWIGLYFIEDYFYRKIILDKIL